MIVQLPDGRRLNVQTNDPKAAALAGKKFLAKENATKMVAAESPLERTVGGVGATLNKSIPFASEAAAAIPTGLDMLRGNSMGDSWRQARANQDAEAADFAKEHPVVAPLTTGTGYGLQGLAAMMTGGATAEPAIAAAGRGLLGKLAARAAPVALNAMKGGAVAALNGAASEGTLAQRARKAAGAVVPGMVIGAAVPAAVGAAAKGVGAVSDAVAPVVAPLVRAGANFVRGGHVPPAEVSRVALQQLSAALKKDGATPDLLKTALNGFMTNGATDPTLVDLAAKLPNGGQNTLALVKSVASGGSARSVVLDHLKAVTDEMQGKAITRTAALTPNTAPANAVEAEAVAARKTGAETGYRPLYDTPVDAQPVIPALEGNTGRQGISAALQGADALRIPNQIDELAQLKEAAKPPPPPADPVARIGDSALPPSPALAAKIRAATGSPPAVDPDAPVPVSLGTLHRIKVGMETMAATEKDPAVQAGLLQRAAEIDDHLAASNDGYSAARDAFRKASAAIDAIGHGQTALTAAPDAYAADLAKLTDGETGSPEAQAMAGIGHRQALTNAIGAPADPTPVLDKIANAANQGANLSTTFGPDAAAHYQAAMQDLLDQGETAKAIRPGGAADDGEKSGADVAHAVLSGLNPHTLLTTLLRKINAGVTLTDAEREAVAKIGTSVPDEALIDRLPAPAADPSMLLPTVGTGVGYAGGALAGAGQ